MSQTNSSPFSRKKLKIYDSKTSSGSRLEANTDEENLDAPRVARWIGEEELQDARLSDTESADSAYVSIFLSGRRH